jgi:integrase
MAINKTEAGSWRVLRTFDTHKDAVKFNKDVQAQVSRREYVRPSDKTVGAVADKWLNRKAGVDDDDDQKPGKAEDQSNAEKQPVKKPTYRRASLVDWKNHVDNYIKPELGHLKVYDLDVEQIENAAAKWGKRVSPKMVNKVLTTLTAVLGLAKRYKWIKDNPAKEAERLKIATEDEGNEVTPDKVYTTEEVGKLINATDPGTIDRLFVMVPVLTGVRIGEALGSTWQHFDLNSGVFHVRLNLADNDAGQPPLLQPPKTKSSRRDIDLPVELIRELKVWKLKCPKSEIQAGKTTVNLVFARKDGLPYHRNAASDALDRAITKAGLTKRLTPHGLRHTFASLLLDKNKPVAEVSTLLGHKDSHVTWKIYAHFCKKVSTATQELAASIFAEAS